MVLSPRFPAVLLILFLLCISTNVGCVRYVRLDLQASNCLNPPNEFCDEAGTNSRVLDVTIYQLKEPVDISALSWEDFQLEGMDFQALDVFLSDPQNKALVRRELTVQRREARTEKIQRLRRFRYLLAVTSGRHEDESSMFITPIRFFQRRQALCFEYYGISEPLKNSEETRRFFKRKAEVCDFEFSVTPEQDSEAAPTE